MTFKAWVRLGRSVCSWSSPISGAGPSAMALGGFGSRMVWGAQRPRAHPTAAATPITSGNGVLKIDNARNAATASATSAGCPKARPPTRITAWATITRTAGAIAARTAVTMVVSPAPRTGQTTPQGDDTRQHEQPTRDQSPGHTVEQPSGIDRQLLGLRPGQQRAERQRVENRFCPIHRFSSTNACCITAICPAGPPKGL